MLWICSFASLSLSHTQMFNFVSFSFFSILDQSSKLCFKSLRLFKKHTHTQTHKRCLSFCGAIKFIHFDGFKMSIGHRRRCVCLNIFCDGRFFSHIYSTTAIFCTNTENPSLTIFGIIYSVFFSLG